MFCFNCGKEVSDSAKFCSECGIKLNDIKNHNTSISNDRSVNFGQNNEISGNTINISHASGEKEENYIKRTKTIRTRLKATWMVGAGLIGVVGSIVSIISYFSKIDKMNLISWLQENSGKMNFLLYTISVSFLIGALGYALMKYRHVKFIYYHLELSKDGSLYLTKFGGKCPKCGSRLNVKLVGSKRNKVIKTVCSRNYNHNWEFDPTVFGEPIAV